MSTLRYKNHYDGLPDTKVFVYHCIDLDPVAVGISGLFSSIVRDSKHVLITDSTLARLHLPKLLEFLQAVKVRVHPIVTRPGDRTKSIQTYVALLDHCAAFGLDRESTVISFGGGVVKDVAGFLASTLFRGLNLIHIPTTVLAQVDAAVDCNQSINLPTGKNLVGTWYSPSEVWVNTAFLASLHERWIRDGLSESIKIALCLSPEFLDILGQAVVSDMEWLARVVERSVSLKLETMKRESKWEDAVKQYGHTVGHAIEHLSSGTIGHGEAIAIGMCVSAEMAFLAGFSDTSTLEKHYDIFRRMKLPTSIPDEQQPSQILAQVRFDKHFVRGETYTPILRCVGSFVEDEKGQVMIPLSEDLTLRALERNRMRYEKAVLSSKI